ncbi:hemerythrin domain-containing protein [Streptomyces sp. NBC_01718]|uniref:hemerythrin domain-containing protein n=2 Tax=unclassified Streptomyces TaxID=2593676 RepID=UPI00352D9405
MLPTVLRCEALGECVERIRPDLLIPTEGRRRVCPPVRALGSRGRERARLWSSHEASRVAVTLRRLAVVGGGGSAMSDPGGSEVCHYCGCREISLIEDFIAEHESATDLAGGAVRALKRGDIAAAQGLLRDMTTVLRAHWRGEENGLFAVMRQDDEYTGYIDDLEREHRDLDRFLDTADLIDRDDRQRFLDTVDELHRHIAKEEDGLFLASLTALGGDDWDRAMAAWCEAHPDVRTP